MRDEAQVDLFEEGQKRAIGSEPDRGMRQKPNFVARTDLCQSQTFQRHAHLVQPRRAQAHDLCDVFRRTQITQQDQKVKKRRVGRQA